MAVCMHSFSSKVDKHSSMLSYWSLCGMHSSYMNLQVDSLRYSHRTEEAVNSFDAKACFFNLKRIKELAAFSAENNNFVTKTYQHLLESCYSSYS